MEFPDWLKGIVLVGKNGANYLPVATDPSGQLYIVLVGAPDVTIPGNVNVNDLNTVKQIQGTDGSAYRTAKLDSNGQFIIVPRGQSGNYMAVDASGFLTAILKGTASGGSLQSIAVDSNGQLIIVPRGQNGNYMAVDASGFLSAILKGQGPSGLSNIALDSSGRMIGVIPDVGGGWNTDAYIGLAELAARLGGLQRWDNRGQMLYGLNFEHGIPKECGITVNGSNTLTLAPGYGYNGSYAADLYTTAGAGGLSQLAWGVAPTQSTKVGLETTFFASAQAGILQLLFDIYSGTQESNPRIRWYLNTGAFQYYGNDSLWHTIGSINIPLNVYTGLSSFKMVVNYSTGKYMRLLANNVTVDLSSYSFPQGASSLQPQIVARVELDSQVGQAVHVYCDDIVVTHNEPT